MAGQPLLKQTSQTSRALELRFFEILGGAFAITEKESFFNGLRGSNQIDKRFRPAFAEAACLR